MKRILYSLLTIVLATVSALCDCKCKAPKSRETTRWGGNIVAVLEVKDPVRQLKGTVRLGDTSAENALLEVFTHPEYLLQGEQKSPKNQRRIAACLSDSQGRFCFHHIKPGKYELRSSMQSGINVTHLYVVIDRNGTDRNLEVVMQMGT